MFPLLINKIRHLSVMKEKQSQTLPHLTLEARSSFLFFRVLLPASLPCRSEVSEWVLRSRIFDPCSSSWNRGLHEIPLILHIRLIRVG